MRSAIPLLVKRLAAVTDWMGKYQLTREFPIGYLGAGTGAAAALMVAVGRPDS